MTITLIGPRGSGKSTVGRLLADRLGWRFADADDEIERRAGRSIREIFLTDGEPSFRTLEREVMADLLSGESRVVAAGGGAVLAAETRTRMQQAGPVVYLAVSIDAALARIAADAATFDRRPALTELPARDEIASILAEREPLYRGCATIQLDADRTSAEDLAAAIAERLPAALRTETAT